MITTTTISAFDGVCRFLNGTILSKADLLAQPEWNSMRGILIDFRNVFSNFPEIYVSQKVYFDALEIAIDYVPIEHTLNTRSFVAVSDIISLHPLILHIIQPQLVPMNGKLGYRGKVTWKAHLGNMMENDSRQKAWQELSLQLYTQKSAYMSESYEMNLSVLNAYEGE